MLPSDLFTTWTTRVRTSLRPRARRERDSDNRQDHHEGNQQLAAARDLERARATLLRPREEDHEQHRVHHTTGQHVEPHAGHGLGRAHPGLLHVSDVQRHAADVRRSDAVDERRCQSGLHRRAHGQPLADTAGEADRREDIGERGHCHYGHEPRPVGRAQGPEAVVDVGELRQKDIEGTREERDRHECLRADADEALERTWLLTCGLCDGRADRAEHGLRDLPAGRRGQCERLQIRHRCSKLRRLERPIRRGHSTLHADERSERSQELGVVDREQPWGGRGLAEPQIDDDWPARRDQHVGGSERAVREARPVEQDHLVPDGVEESIVDRVGIDLVEWASADIVHRQHHRAVGELRQAAEVGAGSAAAMSEHEQERLVLDLVLESRRVVVGRVTQQQRAVPAVEQIGIPAVAAVDLDELALTVAGPGPVELRSAPFRRARGSTRSRRSPPDSARPQRSPAQRDGWVRPRRRGRGSR